MAAKPVFNAPDGTKAGMERREPAIVLPALLIGMALVLAVADLVWGVAGGFSVAGQDYAVLAGLTLLLWMGGTYYQRYRREADLAAMLFGAGFLIGFSAGASVLNNYLLTVAGPSIDGTLAHIDRLLGFDWPGMMTAMAGHPLLNRFFKLAYNSVLPQIALAIVLLGWKRQSLSIYRLCLAIAFGAVVVISIWTLFPSFGAVAVYTLPPDVAARLDVMLDANYGQELVRMLAEGPGYISPANMKGLVGFPSYHVVLALLVAWSVWRIAYWRWPLLVLNAVVVIATPIQGGHHWIDVIAGFPVAVLVAVAADHVCRISARTARARWLESDIASEFP